MHFFLWFSSGKWSEFICKYPLKDVKSVLSLGAIFFTVTVKYSYFFLTKLSKMWCYQTIFKKFLSSNLQ